jgi:type II secretory pathway component PulF
MKWERAQMFRSLSLLQASGIRLDHSLDLVGRQLQHGYTLRRAASVLRCGGSLSQALRESQGLFCSYHQAVIHLGEKSGNLDGCLEYLARHEETSTKLRQKIAAELTYPMLVLAGLLGIVLMLAPWLHLPFWPFALAGLGLAGLWAVRARLPVPAPWKRFRKTWATARFLSCWGSLLEQGIPMLTSLQLSAHASPEGGCRAAVTRIQAGLKAGEPLPESFRKCGYFSPLVVGTIAAGLECGSLDQLLRPLVELYEVELETNLQAVVALLNPLCMLLVGGLLTIFLGTSVAPLLKLAAQL